MSSPVGFSNPGALCYFNSILQAILAALAGRLPDRKELHSAAAGNQIPLLRLCGLPNSQQDAHEAFMVILNRLPALARYFSVRYVCDIFCPRCKRFEQYTDEKTCPPEFYLDAPDEPAATAAEFVKKIRWRTQRVKHKCECGAEDAIQGHRLVRTSAVIAVLFKKYLTKEVRYFPPAITLTERGGAPLRYELVAQVEHFGTQHGGHYTARVRARDGRVVNCNDRSVSPSRFEPTAETYMVFYALTSGRACCA